MEALAKLLFLLWCVVLAASESVDEPLLKIGFGSCHDQKVADQPMWRLLSKRNLDLMVMLGDNVYADKPGPYRGRMPATKEELYKSYDVLFSEPNFLHFLNTTPILATMDDHDYGINDGDHRWKYKADAQHLLISHFDQVSQPGS